MSKAKLFKSREDGVSADEALAHNLKASIAQYEAETHPAGPMKTCCTCGRVAPYGYAIANGTLVEDAAEQQVLRIAREFKAAGLTTAQIAHEFARVGLVPRESA